MFNYSTSQATHTPKIMGEGNQDQNPNMGSSGDYSAPSFGGW